MAENKPQCSVCQFGPCIQREPCPYPPPMGWEELREMPQATQQQIQFDFTEDDYNEGLDDD